MKFVRPHGCGYRSLGVLLDPPDQSLCPFLCQVKGRRVTLPIMPAKGVIVRPSGRFVKLKTAFGLRVKWDGHQQLFVTMSR